MLFVSIAGAVGPSAPNKSIWAFHLLIISPFNPLIKSYPLKSTTPRSREILPLQARIEYT